MNRISIISCAALAMLTAQAFADAYEQCRAPISRSAATLARIDASARFLSTDLQGNAEDVLKFREQSARDASMEWICDDSEMHKDCCKAIPLEIAGFKDSKTLCKYSVAFRYGQLSLKRTTIGGQAYLPEITWKLVDPANTGADLIFGSAGIEVISKFLHRVPVKGCNNVVGEPTQFFCQGNGKGPFFFLDAEADHRANVYPKGRADDSNYLCANIDPLIINTD